MPTLVIYDSNYGNTKLVAEAVAHELGTDAKAIKVDDATQGMLTGLSLLVVGSPINGWRPTVKTTKLLTSLKTDQLKGVKVAAFDTRVRLFMHGDAAKTIAKLLVAAGGTLVGQPQGFNVMGKEGPLLDGELERAKEWTRTLISETGH